MNKEEINTIKEKIRTINPDFSDELLDLLYEFWSVKVQIGIMSLPAFTESEY